MVSSAVALVEFMRQQTEVVWMRVQQGCMVALVDPVERVNSREKAKTILL